MPAQGPCPACGGQLVQVERSGVRIDACRQCRGVFLDRGELDEILKRERSYVDSAQHDDEDFFREMSGKPRSSRATAWMRRRRRSCSRTIQSHKQSKSKHRKKSILDELFG